MNKAVEDTKLINVLVGRNQNDLEAAKLRYRFDLLKRYMLCGHQHFFFHISLQAGLMTRRAIPPFTVRFSCIFLWLLRLLWGYLSGPDERRKKIVLKIQVSVYQ